MNNPSWQKVNSNYRNGDICSSVDVSPDGRSYPDNKYVGQVVYEEVKNREWLMRFMVAKRLNALLEVS